MFNKLRKILVNDGIKPPEYQQIFNNVIGYEDIKLLLYKMITSKYTNSVLLTGQTWSYHFWLTLCDPAVKCQAISNDRYINANPITR
jgi:hypothetical protein